ncbi:RNA polymerase sigma factor, partial [Pseudomonas aeruginosa]
ELGSERRRSEMNRAHDHLGGEGARQRHLDDWLAEPRQCESVGPEQALEAGDQWRRFEAALRGLHERTRRIFLLNRIHGRTYAEIAQAMQLSQSAVEKHMMRALDACKASLAGPAGEQARSAQP